GRDSVHDVHAGASSTLSDLADLRVLGAPVPSKRGFSRRELQNDGAAGWWFSFQNFDVAATNEVLAAGGKNALGAFGFVLVVANRIENLTLIDHVRDHGPSELASIANVRFSSDRDCGVEVDVLNRVQEFDTFGHRPLKGLAS